MSNEAREDLPFWKQRKEMSLQRKAAAAQARSGVHRGDSFLVVTEGEVTEPVYFELLRQQLKLATVKIRVRPGDTSDPFAVIETAARLAGAPAKKKSKGELGFAEIEKYDHVWAVVDREVAESLGKWQELISLAARKGVKLAHSMPCFEFWLILHHEFTTRFLTNGSAAKDALKEALECDYSTNRQVACKTLRRIVQNWPEAVRNAERVREHHHKAGTQEPANPSSYVDLLVRSLWDAVPVPLERS